LSSASEPAARYSGGMLKLLVALLLVASCAHVRPRPHPLEPLSSLEYARAVEVVRAHPALPKDARFSSIALAEPAKSQVLAWRDGQPFSRSAEVHLLHNESARAWVATIDLVGGKVSTLRELAPGTQPAVAASEWGHVAKLVRAHAPWSAALRARGVDPQQVYLDLWAPGHFELPADVQLSHGAHTRLMRALTFYRGDARNPYDRPIEGLVVTVDLNAMKVVHLSDTGMRPISSDSGDAQASTRLKPLRSTRPEGTDILLEGHRVRWHHFSFVLGFHPREGLVLYDVRHDDRPIAYRLSLSEIYVPYGLADPGWSWRSAFDVGEYNAGTGTQPLEPGADVPEHALLLDELLGSDLGVRALPRAVGLYERDAGVLWTRSDPQTDQRDTRVARELVVTWNTVIGNYIYGFDWVFKLDGSLEVITSLNGTTLNRGTDQAAEASAPKIAKDERGVYTAAPHHQHFVSFRLDLDVDGPDNGVMEMDVVPLNDARYKNAFDTTMLHFTQEGARDVAPEKVRHWHIESTHARNALGNPTSFALEPGAFALPYSAPDFPRLQRAGFAAHQLWFTRYREGERYAAGDFPYQAAEPDGLPRYVDGEPLDDVVLWYTTGFTHIARPEDHPVMPGESISFRLIPRGFFPRNPGLDVQAQ
jgi:primary-amine oxidase